MAKGQKSKISYPKEDSPVEMMHTSGFHHELYFLAAQVSLPKSKGLERKRPVFKTTINPEGYIRIFLKNLKSLQLTADLRIRPSDSLALG